MPRDPIKEPPTYYTSSRYNNAWNDPRLDSRTAFHNSPADATKKAPFYLTVDFGSVTKVKKVLMKKRGDNACRGRLINQFVFKYKDIKTGQWVKLGKIATGQKA